MAAVRNLCSRVIQLTSGHIETSGLVDEVISHYLMTTAADALAAVTLPPGLPDTAGFGSCVRVGAIDGTPRTQFRLGELWRIDLEFQLSTPMPHVIAAVGMMNLESLPIVT